MESYSFQSFCDHHYHYGARSKKPESPTFEALGHLWPTWISYLASYLFITIVWVNHHYLLKNATRATLGLIRANFSHLFVVSLIPFLTARMADTRLAVPVAIYAVDFFFVNFTYPELIYQTTSHFRHDNKKASAGDPLALWSWPCWLLA